MRNDPKRPEPRTRSGEVLLTRNHVALLHGLLDRPDGTALSCRDWVRASMPYLVRLKPCPSESCFARSTRTVHPAWVKRRREGRRLVCSLTDRGRAILDLRVAARIRGQGRYEGLKQLISQ